MLIYGTSCSLGSYRMSITSKDNSLLKTDYNQDIFLVNSTLKIGDIHFEDLNIPFL
jgi:hypothetical protein